MNGGGGVEEVKDGLLDLSAAIRIGNKVNLLGAVAEDAAFEDAGGRLFCRNKSFQSELRLKNVRTP